MIFRAGWLATAVFLDLNGVDIAVASNNDIYDLVMAVADRSVDEIVSRLQRIFGQGRKRPS